MSVSIQRLGFTLLNIQVSFSEYDVIVGNTGALLRVLLGFAYGLWYFELLDRDRFDLWNYNVFGEYATLR